MDTVTYDPQEENWDRYDDDRDGEDRMPGRPRRQYFNRRSAALAALVLCAAGFYGGVRVEKGQLSSSTSTFPLASGLRAGAGGAAGAAGTAGTAGTSGAAASTSGAAAGSGAAAKSGAGAGAGAAGGLDAGGFAARFGAAGGAGGNASFGTVSSIDGKTLYVTESSGTMVKVKLASSTKVTKSLSVSRKSVRPGDTVVIEGVKNSSGTIVAASVSDSGAAAARSGSTSSSGATGSSSSGSGVSSLFSSGGAG